MSVLSVSMVEGCRWLVSDRPIARIRSFSEVSEEFGGSVFIVASGPTVKDFDFESYREQSFIAVNGSVSIFLDKDIRPCFYLCDDVGFARGRVDLLKRGLYVSTHVAMSFAVFSVLYESDKSCLIGKSIFLLERVNRPIYGDAVSDRKYAWSIRHDKDLICGFSIFRRSPNRIGFSRNLDKGYFVARTIPYVALQLSYCIGAKRVFLVGVDFNSGAGRFYESGAHALPSSLDEDYDKLILPSFKFMSDKIVKASKFEVYNLSLSSRLPMSVVPKIEASELRRLLVELDC
jgi:Kdo-III transferase WaaZ